MSEARARILEAARDYLRRGWPVVPIAPAGKRPLVKWEAFQKRCPTMKELEGWFLRWPNANIAIVTGRLSGLAVLDIDPRHGGEDSLAELEQDYGPLPETPEALTGGGGRHLYFGYPTSPLHNLAGLKPGIDLRAEGGIVIAPPSLHASGRTYEWEVSHHPDETPASDLPSWLLALCRRQGREAGHPAAHWRDLVAGGIGEGARNSTIASLTGHLLWRDVDLEVIKELLCSWNRDRCHPPLPDEEVLRTVESIARTHQRHKGEERPPDQG